MNKTDNKIQEAIVKFGQSVVDVVLDIVRLSDEDGAYTLFNDYGMNECRECVKFLYFKG